MDFFRLLFESDLSFFLLIGVISLIHQVIQKVAKSAHRNDSKQIIKPNQTTLEKSLFSPSSKLKILEKGVLKEVLHSQIQEIPQNIHTFNSSSKLKERKEEKTISSNSYTTSFPSPRKNSSSSKGNIARKLLQKNGLREIILLKEILGKPKALS